MTLAPILVLSRPYVVSLEPYLADSETEFAAAVKSLDSVRAAGLALAARLRGHAFRLTAEQLEWLLPRLEDPVLLPCLVSCCLEPEPVLLRLLEREPDLEVQVAALLSAAILARGRAPSAALVSQARRLSRVTHPTFQLPIGAACELLDDARLRDQTSSLRSLARSIGFKLMVSRFERCLAGDFLEALPDLGATGLTARRTAPKVGRNEPCPCGSGKKLKKCCEKQAVQQVGPALPAPTRVNPRKLAVNQLIALDPHELPLVSLELLVEELGQRGLLEEAERALDVFLAHPDQRDHPDDCRYGLILDAQSRRDLGVLTRQIEALDPEGAFRLLRRGALLVLRDCPLIELEAFARELLQNRDAEIDFAHFLLDLRPGLGVVFARASLGLDRDLDSVTLLQSVEEALADLELPPDDRFQELWDVLSESDGRTGDESDLRQRLQATSDEVQLLKSKLQEAEEQVSLAQSPSPVIAPEAAKEPLPEQEAELKRLRGRLAEVKQLLKERNQERTELRQQLLRRPTVDEPQPGMQEEEEEPGEPTSERYPVLVPDLGREAIRELEALPTARAAQSMRLIGQLCAGDEAAWAGVKSLKMGDCYSARIGLHHRLLFRVNREGRRLVVDHMIPRSSLERHLRRD